MDGLDQRAGRILLVVDDPRSSRTQRVELRYDQRTRLYYQGRELAVEGLERGDVVRVDAMQSGRELWARTIDVVRDVRDGGYGRDDGYGSELRGSVAWVDARSGRIRLDGTGYAAGRGAHGAGYDAAPRGNTGTALPLRTSSAVTAARAGAAAARNQWLAERIIVERSVR